MALSAASVFPDDRESPLVLPSDGHHAHYIQVQNTTVDTEPPPTPSLTVAHLRRARVRSGLAGRKHVGISGLVAATVGATACPGVIAPATIASTTTR